MSRKVIILIGEQSTVIRTGLVGIVGRVPNFIADIYESDNPDTFRNYIIKYRPDIIIYNPSWSASLNLRNIEKDVVEIPLKVAIQSVLMDQEILKSFDEVISIYDPEDAIREKIGKLASEPRQEQRQEPLSNREKEVIVCVIKGMTNKQIAEQLCLSAHTVMAHRRNITSKLGIRSSAGLTIYAIVNKLVGLDEIETLV